MAKDKTKKKDKPAKAEKPAKKAKAATAAASDCCCDCDCTGGAPPMPKFKNVAKKRLTTGKGASAAEVGASLVQLFNRGKASEVEKLWHHKKIESIEGDGSVFLGKKGVDEKNAWWHGAFESHNAVAEGPFVGATGFSVHFTMEVSPRGGGERMTMREIGVYTVEKGKIVREEFMALGCGA